MQVLETIERIKAPCIEVFEKEYILPQKPVIITDLFESQPIRQIRTLEDAKTQLGSLLLEIQEEFTSFAFRKSMFLDRREKQNWSLQQYLNYVEQHPETRLICSEGATPVEILQQFDMPSYARMNSDANFSDVASLLFLGNAGNYAHLHFDGDYRQVLLHQVFGRKRVILIPAIQSKKLAPIGNTSTILLENFSEADKHDFIQYTQGYDCILQPGETIFMPAGIWHHLEYCDTGMSFSIRFGRNEFLKFFGDRLHANAWLQNIATHFVGSEIASDRQALFQEIETVYRTSYPTPLEKAKALETVLKSIYDRLYPSEPQKAYALTNLDPLVDLFLETEAARLYTPPASSLRSVLMGWKQVGV